MSSIKSFTCVDKHYSGRRISISSEKYKMMFYRKKINVKNLQSFRNVSRLLEIWNLKQGQNRYFRWIFPIDFSQCCFKQISLNHSIYSSLFSRARRDPSFIKISSYSAYFAQFAQFLRNSTWPIYTYN